MGAAAGVCVAKSQQSVIGLSDNKLTFVTNQQAI